MHGEMSVVRPEVSRLLPVPRERQRLCWSDCDGLSSHFMTTITPQYHSQSRQSELKNIYHDVRIFTLIYIIYIYTNHIVYIYILYIYLGNKYIYTYIGLL